MAPSRHAGFTIIELLMVMAILGIVASLAVIGTRQAKIRTAETVAVADLRSINQAQFAFAQACGRQAYAGTLASLGVPPPGGDSAFLSPDLTRSDPLQKSGYVIQLGGTAHPEAPTTCNGAPPLASYYLTADPLTSGHNGQRSFGTNTDRVIFADAVTFAGNMPESGNPAHGAEIR